MAAQQIFWTPHAEYKMKGYGLSRQRILRIIHHPERTEEGILEGAVAVMQPVSLRVVEGKKLWRQEIWAMYILDREVKRKKMKAGDIRIISAWRYPGVSPARQPIPADILREIASMLH